MATQTWTYVDDEKPYENADEEGISYTQTAANGTQPYDAVVLSVTAYVRIAPTTTSTRYQYEMHYIRIVGGPTFEPSYYPTQQMLGSNYTVFFPGDRYNPTGSFELTGSDMSVFRNTSITAQAYIKSTRSSTVTKMRGIYVTVEYAIPQIKWGQVKAEPSEQYVKLTWDPITATGGVGSVTYTVGSSTVTSPCYITPSAYNTSQSYSIVAHYSGATSTKTVSCTVYGVQNAPTDVVATAQGGGVKVTWTAASVKYGGGSIKQYNIRYKISGSNTWLQTFTNKTSGVILTGLTEGSLIFEVIAVYSENSNITSSAVSSTIKWSASCIWYWSGSQWVECVPYYWSGTQWIECVPYYWNGSQWIEC